MRPILKIFFFVLFCITQKFSLAQSCGNCKLTSSVAQYDLDVEVAQLGEQGELMFQWKQLFWLGVHANAYLFKTNNHCIRFTQPATSVDENGTEYMTIGETYTTLPGRDVSAYGNYIITGFVKKSGNGESYIMHMELQAACNRKVVAVAEISFQLNELPAKTRFFAQQAAMQLSPLAEKINQFEKEEREKNQNTAISGLFSEAIVIKPMKSKLLVGQETEVEFEVKDCDGQPLKNRTLSFDKAHIEGFKINGTIGGIVTPSQVITNAQGIARAKFKLTSTTQSIISVHSMGKNGKGCVDALYGSKKIDILPAFKVSLNYFRQGNMVVEMKSKDSLFSINIGGEKSRWEVAGHSTYYCYEKITNAGNAKVYYEKDDPSSTSKVVFMETAGYSDHIKMEKPTEAAVIPLGSKHTEEAIPPVKTFSTNATTPDVDLEFINKELTYFNFSMDFETEEGNTLSISIDFRPGDKEVTVTSKKITDPNSYFKTEYLIQFKKDDSAENQFGKRTDVETATIILLSPF